MIYRTFLNSQEILDFWFLPKVQPLWFVRDIDLDTTIQKRYGKIYQELVDTCGEEMEFQRADEALACVIVLDQFSRNMYRDSPKAFAMDEWALKISKQAIQSGLDQKLAIQNHRNFLYMPFMHSENLEDQEEGIRLFSSIPGNEASAGYARQHRDIIAMFGRFPHRNKVLGRDSTPEEVEFLKEFPGF